MKTASRRREGARRSIDRWPLLRALAHPAPHRASRRPRYQGRARRIECNRPLRAVALFVWLVKRRMRDAAFARLRIGAFGCRPCEVRSE